MLRVLPGERRDLLLRTAAEIVPLMPGSRAHFRQEPADTLLVSESVLFDEDTAIKMAWVPFDQGISHTERHPSTPFRFFRLFALPTIRGRISKFCDYASSFTAGVMPSVPFRAGHSAQRTPAQSLRRSADRHSVLAEHFKEPQFFLSRHTIGNDNIAGQSICGCTEFSGKVRRSGQQQHQGRLFHSADQLPAGDLPKLRSQNPEKLATLISSLMVFSSSSSTLPSARAQDHGIYRGK